MGSKLRKIRREKDISLKEIAAKSGVSIRSLEKYDSGERLLLNAKLETGLLIADALGVDVKEII